MLGVLDTLGGSSSAEKIRERRGRVFELSPDLEGVQPAALTRALQDIRPTLTWQEWHVKKLVEQAARNKTKGGPVKLIYDAAGVDGDNVNRLKKELAPKLAQYMLQLGPADKIKEIVWEVLSLAFGYRCPQREVGSFGP